MTITTATTITTLADIQLSKGQGQALSQQLYSAIRDRVLTGQLPPGTRLAPSRTLAEQLQVSRNTVLTALDQLQAEGYLQTRLGSAVWVTEQLPDYQMQPLPTPSPDKKHGINATLSKLGRAMSNPNMDSVHPNNSFALGAPALDHFPTDIWQRLNNRNEQLRHTDLLGFHDNLGYLPLRQALCQYLKESRALNCKPEQVLITYGAQQALDLCARVLTEPGDKVIIEEPGYHGAKSAFSAAGVKLIGGHVDEQGLQIEHLNQLNQSSTPKALYTTPAHQYPLGHIMPLTRRLQLLEWTAQHNCWLIEDDYDSEYHFTHRPLPALQGLAQHDQVIYLGSFSKVIFPALRLGYLVLPPALITPFANTKFTLCAETALHNQVVTASFINEGHFKTHLKRMRVLYGERWQIMRRECEQQLPEWCEVQAENAGMHLVVRFHRQVDDAALQQYLAEQQISAHCLSDFYLQSPTQRGLVLGFANSSPQQISSGVAVIAAALKAF